MFGSLGFKLAAAAFFLIAAFVGGFKTAHNACKAKEADRLAAEIAARQVDESFAQGVSTAYEGVAAQLRRLAAVNRVEVTRETSKIEYRCELPAGGERLRLDTIRAANAASGEPDPGVPANPTDTSKGSGGTTDSVHRTGEPVR